MKKGIVILLLACVLFSATGCSMLNGITPHSKPTDTVFAVDNYRLQITADSTFHPDTGGNFDLQITNNNSYISIMAFQYIDLPENATPQDVYDMQNEALFSKRTAVAVIEEPQTQYISQRVITQGLHSAENDGIKNYYATYLIDLPEEETFVWVLVTAMPSYLKENREYLDNIVYSLTPVE